LVTPSHPAALSKAITDATGAKVAVLRRADAGGGPLPAGVVSPSEPELVERVVTALAGVAAQHVLLVIGPATGQLTRIEVIPVETARMSQ
jgi:hypothetical protein